MAVLANSPTELYARYRKRQRLAWLLLAFSIAGFLGIIALEWAGCSLLFNPDDLRPANAYGLLMVPLNALAFSLMGALVITLRPANRYGWVMLLFGMFMNLFLLPDFYANCSLSGQVDLPLGAEALWAGTFAGGFFGIAIFLLLALFPDGRFLSIRWRQIGLVLITLNVILATISAFTPGLIGLEGLAETTENPFALDLFDIPGLRGLVDEASNLLMAVSFLVAVASVLQRWRLSEGEIRLQMKWFMFFVVTSGMLFFAVEIIGSTVYPPVFDGWFYLIELTVFWIGFPLVIGLAVIKYRLFDIDIIIRRTLVYTLLTAMLIAVYFSIVLLIQAAFVAFTGQENPIAIVISTLVIAALFNPLRQRIQSFIDRRFYRSSYDAARTLENFAHTVRDEVDLDQISSVLMRSIDETMQPQTAVLWLADERPSQLGDDMGQ
jgi:hypothetical protein